MRVGGVAGVPALPEHLTGPHPLAHLHRGRAAPEMGEHRDRPGRDVGPVAVVGRPAPGRAHHDVVAQQVPRRAEAAHEPLEQQVRDARQGEAAEMVAAGPVHSDHLPVERGEHLLSEGREPLGPTHRRPERIQGAGRGAVGLVGDVEGVGLRETMGVGGDARGGGVQPPPPPAHRHRDRDRVLFLRGALEAGLQELADQAQHDERDPQQVGGTDPSAQRDRHDDQHGAEAERRSGQSQQ